MFRRLVTALAISAALWPMALGYRSSVAAAAEKPNIVIFYLDDTDPMDGRLWNDPALTPNLHNLFVAQGIQFRNAFGETPLCCPSRATLFTGLHTHNHGVLINDGALFNPGETLAKGLQRSGYHTMIVGKYLNKVYQFSAADWSQHVVGWNDMDVFANNQAIIPQRWYYNYDVRQRDGTITHYDTTHSTRFVAEDGVARIRSAPADKPLFALLSPFDTHTPNIAMPEFNTDARCDAMPPWLPGNYDEDVSDKPAYVRKHVVKVLPPEGYPLVRVCRQMLGFDWMVGEVVQELVAQGRFANTLFVFTADNGMTWGEHRLPNNKHTPYATPVGLYMSWPNAWGTDPLAIDEFVSDIDLAPTFCAVAQCTLGPFPGGQAHPDGLSLLPVINGALQRTPTHLGRDALLHSNFRVAWWGVRTTLESPLGLWTYTEWNNGDLELYDMASDPWQLDNRAYDSAFDAVRSALRQRLAQLKLEGQTNSPAGSVTIVQNSAPNSAADFAFSGSFGAFVLDDDSNTTLPRKRVFSELTPGNYILSQNKVVGWSLKSVSCPGADVDLTTRSVVIHVYQGSALTCTFNNVRQRPDGSIALIGAGPYKGNNVYSSQPISEQTMKREGVTAGQEYAYFVKVQNDGKQDDSFVLEASVTAPSSMTATFWAGGTEITANVMAGTYTTAVLGPSASVTIEVRVAVSLSAPTGAKSVVVVKATSVAEPSVVDAVRATTKR